MRHYAYTKLNHSIITQSWVSITEGRPLLRAMGDKGRVFAFPRCRLFYRLVPKPSVSNRLRAYFGEGCDFLPEEARFIGRQLYLPGIGPIPYVPCHPEPLWIVRVTLQAIVNHWFIFFTTQRYITIPLLSGAQVGGEK